MVGKDSRRSLGQIRPAVEDRWTWVNFGADYLETGAQVPRRSFFSTSGRAQNEGSSESFGCLGQEKGRVSVKMAVKQG